MPLGKLVFHEVVNMAARAEFVAGNITVTERDQVLSATACPNTLEAIQCGVYDHILQNKPDLVKAGDGTVVPMGAVNWQNLIAFIQAIIPLIIQIINLFNPPKPTPTPTTSIASGLASAAVLFLALCITPAAFGQTPTPKPDPVVNPPQPPVAVIVVGGTQQHARPGSAPLVIHTKPGELVVLDGSTSVGAGHQWLEVPATNHSVLPVDNGTKLVLARGNQTSKPQAYNFVLSVAGGNLSSMAQARVIVAPENPCPPGPTPGPTPNPNPGPNPGPSPGPNPTAQNPFFVQVTDNANEASLPPSQQTLVENNAFWIGTLPGRWREVDISDPAAAPYKAWLDYKKVSPPALVPMDTTKSPVEVLGVEPYPTTADQVAALILKYTTKPNKFRRW